MKTRTRIELVGACIGLVWALMMPMYYGYDYSTQPIALIAIAGVITGILLSLALWKLLIKSSHWVALCIGLLALPLGVFCFGVICGTFSLIIGLVTGGGYVTFSGVFEVPLYEGWMFVRVTAMVCSRWYLGFIIFPLAAVMSYLLQLAILYKKSSRAST